MKTIAMLSLVASVALSGCAVQPQTVYGKAGATAETERKDFAECRHEGK